MQSHVETLTADNGAAVEVATIYSPNGTPHTAHGAIIDLERGYVVAYVIENIPPKTGAGWGPKNRQYAYRGELQTFDGRRIGTWEHVSTWTRCGRWDCHTMRAISARVDGDPREWHGRYGSDWSQAVTLRPAK